MRGLSRPVSARINIAIDGFSSCGKSTLAKQLARHLGYTYIDSGAITELARIAVPTSPDNIDVAADSSLTVAGHANTMKLIMHFIKGTPAPSQVLRVIPDNDGNAAIDEIYLNAGDGISASSVGATYGNKLLIGSITDRKLLVCEQN